MGSSAGGLRTMCSSGMGSKLGARCSPCTIGIRTGTCRYAPCPRQGYDPCPEYAKRRRDFPTALRERLAQNGYLIAEVSPSRPRSSGRVPASTATRRGRPARSKSVGRPGWPSWTTSLAAGYAFIKTTQGRAAADAIGIPYWKAIAQCDGDEGCIAQRQSEEIVALAQAGAPVSLPPWTSGPASAPQPQPPVAPSAPSVAKAPEEPAPASKPDHESASGTGFFITADGAVVTNAHVVEGCSAIRVTSDQGATAVAKVVARDDRNDLALLGTGLAARKTAAFRTSIRLGEAVEAFGYPLTGVLCEVGKLHAGQRLGAGRARRGQPIPADFGARAARELRRSVAGSERKSRRRRVCQAECPQDDARHARRHRPERQLRHQGLNRDQLLGSQRRRLRDCRRRPADAARGLG